MTLTFENQAAVFYHSLALGLISDPVVIQWARAVIELGEVVPDWLQQLADKENTSTSQRLNLLQQIMLQTDSDTWWPQFKQQIYSALSQKTLTAQNAANYCYNLALVDSVPAYDREALYQFEWEYDATLLGFATPDEVNHQVLGFFSPK